MSVETNNKNKGGMIILVIFLLICSGLGIAAFTMSFTKKCGEGFDTGNYCVSCGDKATESTGPMGSGEGASQCITMASWLSSPPGVSALTAAMENIKNDKTFAFNISGNATTATNSDQKGDIVYRGSGECGGGTTTFKSGNGGYFEFEYDCAGSCKNTPRGLKLCYPGAWGPFKGPQWN